MPRRLTPAQARRAVLGSLGMARRRPSGAIDVRHLRRVYADIGIIQIDPINVLARAHHQVVMSRLGPYDTQALDAYIWRSGEVYEGWIHVDATTATDAWPLLAHRRAETLPWRAVHATMERRPGYLSAVLEEVAERGPLSARELRDPGDRTGSWGTRSIGRAALDYHHLRGDLAIAWRDDRMTAYFDLTERVVPAVHRTAEVPEPRQAERALLLRGLQTMGLGNAADIADHHRQHIPTARTLLAELASEGEVDVVEVAGWQGPVYASPDLRIPRRIGAATLLNPFDPVMWNRSRVSRLFGLNYTVEIYVPAAKRRYGYYVLPFLQDDQITALVDLKHDRKRGRLLVQAAHHHAASAGEPVAAALAVELREWAGWVGADEVEVVEAGDLATDLQQALAP